MTAPAREPRCHMTDKRRNPCPNPQLTDLGICMRHLREAADEWARVVAEATAKAPALGRMLAKDAA